MQPESRTGPVLGLESSCDETAAAVLGPDGSVLAEAVLSQLEEHRRFGGVVPEIAARAHLAHLPGLVRQVLAQAGVRPAALAGVGASCGPGLIGGLIVGAGVAKGIALAAGVPFVAVNHLEAHALTPRLLKEGAAFPYLLLLLSGGHCQCVAVEGVGAYRLLGSTIDDAVGEAFDKVGKLLGLPWPGGPEVERLAAGGDAKRFPLPRPLLGRAGCDFSFSGLKTAVAQRVAAYPAGPLPRQDAADLAASFQSAVADVLADRAEHALGAMPDARLMVVAGGVAANGAVRTALTNVAARHGLTLIAPPIRLCTDNATMVAWATLERLRLGLVDDLSFKPRPRWPLAELSHLPLPPAGEGTAMNYRHAFHVGNPADCLKHALLVWIVDALRRKETPFFVLDTHAGTGSYDLDGAAERTGEWRDGIARLLHEPPEPLRRYVEQVAAEPGYPGSPLLIRNLLRDDDRLACCELHPEDAAELRTLFRRDKQVGVHERDGYEAVRALLPPKQRRGLVLLDPPYEAAGEFDRVLAALQDGASRFDHGIYAAWYPIKHRSPVNAFHQSLRAAGLRDIVAAELWLRAPLDPARLNGSGLLVRNPPHGFEPAATAILQALLDRLGNGEAGQGCEVLRLVDE